MAGQMNDAVNYAYDTLTKNGYNPYYLYKQKNPPTNFGRWILYFKDGKITVL